MSAGLHVERNAKTQGGKPALVSITLNSVVPSTPEPGVDHVRSQGGLLGEEIALGKFRDTIESGEGREETVVPETSGVHGISEIPQNSGNSEISQESENSEISQKSERARVSRFPESEGFRGGREREQEAAIEGEKEGRTEEQVRTDSFPIDRHEEGAGPNFFPNEPSLSDTPGRGSRRPEKG
jgi:hypothetical protein